MQHLVLSMEDKGNALLNACQYVKRTGQAVRKAARLYGVPETSLRRRMQSPEDFEPKVGHPTLFTLAEEAQLADHCKRMARLGYGYCRWQILQMASNMMKNIGKEFEPKKDWYYGFIKRFPDLRIQKPKKREVSRVLSTTETNIDLYFTELGEILEKYNLKNKPAQIWNVDETGISLDHNPPKVVAAANDKPFVVTAGRSCNTTVIVAGNALGETIPPYMIYKGQRLTSELTNGCLPGTKYTTSQTGWSNSDTFEDFLVNHFMKYAETKPCILLYDGHTTHITVNLIEQAREANIHLFVLPPHSSHQLQPLDVGIFSPFKAALSSECHKLSHTHVGRQITRQDLPSLIATAYESAVTVQNLMSAFRKTGIVPFNPEAVALPQLNSENVTAKSRPERANVRSIKLLLTSIDKQVSETLNTKPERSRKYVIPPSGTAITETEFLEKLKESSDNSKAKTMPQKSDKGKPKTKAVKRKKTNTPKNLSKGKKIRKQSSQQKQQTVDSQVAGPSKPTNQWATHYNSEESENEDDDALCCICNLFSPKSYRESVNLEILSWAKCDICKGWVHLKYCSPVRSVGRGEAFSCKKCQN